MQNGTGAYCKSRKSNIQRYIWGGCISEPFGRLPDNYINKKVARKSGWKDYKGNLSEVLPGKRIGGDVYRNANEKLPDSENRIWYEADINYSSGYRNKARILYSNDGLIFVTYDHYTTFYEITGGE